MDGGLCGLTAAVVFEEAVLNGDEVSDLTLHLVEDTMTYSGGHGSEAKGEDEAGDLHGEPLNDIAIM